VNGNCPKPRCFIEYLLMLILRIMIFIIIMVVGSQVMRIAGCPDAQAPEKKEKIHQGKKVEVE
jgi:hypothetical protein